MFFLSFVIFCGGFVLYMEKGTIGTRIKQRRKMFGLTQTQIKELTGISSGNISEIENGNKLPSAPALISLSNILKCSTDWILTGKDSILSNEISSSLSQEDSDWLDLLHELPPEERQNCFIYMRGFVDGVNRDKNTASKRQEKAVGE